MLGVDQVTPPILGAYQVNVSLLLLFVCLFYTFFMLSFTSLFELPGCSFQGASYPYLFISIVLLELSLDIFHQFSCKFGSSFCGQILVSTDRVTGIPAGIQISQLGDFKISSCEK